MIRFANMIKRIALALCVLLISSSMLAQKKESRVMTLNEMFQLATENSKQLILSQKGIEVAQRATEAVKTSRLPSIDISLSASYLGDGTIMDRDFTNVARAPMPHFGNNFSVEASQVVFAGGAISNSIAKAELQEQMAQLSYEKDQMDIRFLLTGYYLELYKLMNQREVYVRNIEQTNLLIKQIKAKHNEGMALNNDITRHELTLQNYELALIEIDNNYDILNHYLVATLGLPYNTVILPDPKILDMDLSSTTPVDLMQIAESNLPELKSAEVNIEIVKKNVKLAKADYWPSIALVAANRFDGPITIEVPAINKNFNYWYVGVGLKFNLSSLFKSNKSVRLAKSQQSIAVDAKDLLMERTEIAVYNDAVRYEESFEKLNTFKKSLDLATENYRIINNRYTNDLVLITEMLDAGNTKLNAELLVVNAQINIIYNYYKLQRTIGKL